MRRLPLWMTLCLLSSTPLVFAAGNPTVGKTKAEACGGCHGVDGNSSAPIFPKLASQHASFIAKQLHDFKSQKRIEPTMNALAEPLTDSEIEDLSAYYALQKITIEKGAPNPLGEKIYRTGNLSTQVPACIGCHGPSGNGNPQALFPQLNGQYAAYIEKTMHDFKTKSRTNDLNNMMQAISARLTDEEISAVADYISTLR